MTEIIQKRSRNPNLDHVQPSETFLYDVIFYDYVTFCGKHFEVFTRKKFHSEKDLGFVLFRNTLLSGG